MYSDYIFFNFCKFLIVNYFFNAMNSFVDLFLLLFWYLQFDLRIVCTVDIIREAYSVDCRSYGNKHVNL